MSNVVGQACGATDTGPSMGSTSGCLGRSGCSPRPGRLTDLVPKDRRGKAWGSADRRQLVLFAVLVAVVVRLIVLAALSHGAIHTLGLVMACRSFALLVLIVVRSYRKRK